MEVIHPRAQHGVFWQNMHKGRLKYHLHRRLTEDIGHPKLREHISNVITLMKASSSWGGFRRLLNRSLPKLGHAYEIPFDDEDK